MNYTRGHTRRFYSSLKHDAKLYEHSEYFGEGKAAEFGVNDYAVCEGLLVLVNVYPSNYLCETSIRTVYSIDNLFHNHFF